MAFEAPTEAAKLEGVPAGRRCVNAVEFHCSVSPRRALEITAGVHPAPEAEEFGPLALELARERPVAIPLEVAAARSEEGTDTFTLAWGILEDEILPVAEGTPRGGLGRCRWGARGPGRERPVASA